MRAVYTAEPDNHGAVWVIYEINAPNNRWVAFRYTTSGAIQGSYRGPTYDYALAHITGERTRLSIPGNKST